MISLSNIVKAKWLCSCPGDENGIGVRTWNNMDTSAESNRLREEIMGQAIKNSRQIVEEAEKRADALIQSAKEEGSFIRAEAGRQGYQVGYEQGLADGISEVAKTAEEGLKEIEELIAAIRKEQRQAVERQEKDILLIAFEVAKKIMRQQIHMEENALLNMLKEVILENEAGVKIHLSEYSKTLDTAIGKNIARKIRNVSQNAKVIVTHSDDLIMAETENGVVDMSIPIQLKRLQEEIGLGDSANPGRI